MVHLIDCGKKEFLYKISNKKVYCFGAGRYFEYFLLEYKEITVEAVIDNCRYMVDDSVQIGLNSIKIISVDNFKKIYTPECIVVITCEAFDEILEELDHIEIFEDMDCYISLFIKHYTEDMDISVNFIKREEMIPRKIHFCWFGGRDIPKEYQKNIDSWKRFCPQYEIIRWDETNYDISQNSYMKQAYEAKKWAFVTDYARVDILYKEGGVYFDTDVELIKSFDDFLMWRMFCGFESSDAVAWGLGFGSVKGESILKEVLDVYKEMTFLLDDGSFNMTPCPIIQSEIMKKYGFRMNGQFQVKDQIAIYPKVFFSPLSYIRGLGRITDNTHSIHHYSASWQNKEQQYYRVKLEKRIQNIFLR